MAEQRKGDHKDPKIGNDDVLRQVISDLDGGDLFLKDGNKIHVEWVEAQSASSGNEQEPLSLLPSHYLISTDRNDFFRVAPFDVVHGDDQIVESSTYGGGNRTVGVSNDSTSPGVVVSPILEVQEKRVIGLANVSITSSDVTGEQQEHGMGSNGEFEEDLVNDGWWEKWLVLISLWKLA